MICQSCGKKEANVSIKTVINGHLKEEHYCSECAAKNGASSGLMDFGASFSSLLGGMFSGLPKAADEPRCESCGASFDEISKDGNMGCPDCYNTFRARINPMIQRIHGTSRHSGKKPESMELTVTDNAVDIVPVVKEETPVESKKRELNEAVEAQNFEYAAKLRDEIKELEQNG